MGDLTRVGRRKLDHWWIRGVLSDLQNPRGFLTTSGTIGTGNGKSLYSFSTADVYISTLESYLLLSSVSQSLVLREGRVWCDFFCLAVILRVAWELRGFPVLRFTPAS